MSAITLRPRRPLESLPLAYYTSSTPLPPSPVSLPNKRPLTSSPGRAGTGEASTSTSTSATSHKHRKVSGEDHHGHETIRRKRSEITPRAKKALAEDEFGTGKSPARRLFVDDVTSFGISGAVLPSPSRPNRTLDFKGSPSNSPGTSRTLAPSPPISSAPSPIPHENGAIVDVHDIGFTIHPDPATVVRSHLGTPDSRPNRSTTSDASSVAPLSNPLLASPSSRLPDNDQENQPPPQTTPSSSSAHSTPSKSSISGSASSARFYDDNDIVNLTGSGRRRIRGPSKLNEVLKSAAPVGQDEGEEDDELTPGRTKAADKGKGKQKMAIEVDQDHF